MALDPQEVGRKLLEGRIDLAIWQESNEMAAAVRSIQEFCQKEGKAVQIDYKDYGHGHEWVINNYNMDCIPLAGWTWTDPNLYNGQPTLALAWQVFMEELGNARRNAPKL